MFVVKVCLNLVFEIDSRQYIVGDGGDKFK